MFGGVASAAVAALVGGVQIFLVKSHLDDRSATVVASVVPLLGLCWYLPLVGVVAPDRASVDFGSLSPAAWVVVLGGIVTGGLGTLLFFTALRSGQASYVAPISKTVPLFVLPIELAFLPVSLRGPNVAGVFVITAGLCVANYEAGVSRPLAKLTSRPAKLSLASAASFGAFDVIQRTLLQEFAVPTTTWVVLNRGGIGLSLLAVVFVGDTARRGIVDVPAFLVVGCLNSLVLYFGVRAFALLPASVASPIVNTQSVVAVVLGGVVLDEQYFGRRLVAVALVVAGVVFVSM